MLSLSLAEVSMSYPGLAAPVLTVVKLTVQAGQHLAITGASGSGKSTFVNLITGLERASGGEICWSNVDIADRYTCSTRRVLLIAASAHSVASPSCLPSRAKASARYCVASASRRVIS